MEAVVKITDFSIENVLAKNNELRCKLKARDHHIKLLEEKINHLIYHRFSPKSDTKTLATSNNTSDLMSNK
ncbi:MAG: hypothetical protein MRK01_13705 [Candidatus Scalindua sp.]|nr:hypothetical protein [Candidatus Scalindua sp.]